ncbi:hypothetical protein LSAT2_032497 [Lamellibrachia satsuma]|nr:hypothetical protein LSAT2_032497 [Lamellibrachia satsuma]
MLAVVIVAYTAIMAASDELAPDDIQREWRHQPDSIDRYLAATVDQTDIALVGEIRRTESDLFARLDGLPAYTRRRFISNIETPSMQLQDVARELPVLSRSLEEMGIATWRLRSLAKQLNGVLAETRWRLMNLLPPCSNATTEHIASALNCSDVATAAVGNETSHDEQRTTDLTNAWKLLTSLTMNTNYADNEAVTKAKLMTDLATRMHFKGLVDNAMAAYEALMANLREITEERVRRLKDSLDVTEDNVTKSFLWLNQIFMTVRDANLSIVDYEHYIDTFQHYYKYTCIVLTSVLLLLVWKVQPEVQWEVPLKKDFRRRQATNILKYGAACTYIVVCRPCITRDATLERYVDLTKQEANVTYDVTLAGVLRHCRDNETVYLAFNVEHSTLFNLSEILNLHDVYEALEQLEDVFIGFDDFQVFRSTVWTIVRAIAKEFESVDFVAYLNTSRSNVTKVSLTQYASLLDNVCADMPDLALANKLSRETKHLYDTCETWKLNMSERCSSTTACCGRL